MEETLPKFVFAIKKWTGSHFTPTTPQVVHSVNGSQTHLASKAERKQADKTEMSWTWPSSPTHYPHPPNHHAFWTEPLEYFPGPHLLFKNKTKPNIFGCTRCHRDLTSPTRDQTSASCRGSAESYALARQGRPLHSLAFHPHCQALFLLIKAPGVGVQIKPEKMTFIVNCKTICFRTAITIYVYTEKKFPITKLFSV